ncbi:MAG: formate--tetrahydrofolate ligase [Saprospiraceae bacterium]|nr:formate--tetrahydrofolate ligase [Saprospiraceae bacterium]MDP4999126.1 formate--tetrahydrofolate ligase [Saprospiraceae bacterium]
MKTDIEIAQGCTLQDIGALAVKLGLGEKDLIRYGHYKAKLPLSLIDEEKAAQSKLILVSAISPTPAGEGKTTMSIGLSEALNQIGKQTTAVLREPSLGPVFGIKGGATGGGYAQVLPMEDINLHFTGDFSAVEKAHNLLAALIDNNIQSKANNLNLDPRTVVWKRVMDMNDRALRQIIVGLGGVSGGVPRETGFDITAASEVMAILCLSSNLEDLKTRLGNIFVGFTYDKKPVYARDLQANGAMAALLKDAIQPNLVQTIEGNPAILHGGPFANIAQGTNTVIATKMGLSLSDYVVTEAGFGFDLGAEKFLDIKCQHAGLSPRVVVLVATIRALKYHGGIAVADLKTPNPDAVAKGMENLEKHLENARFLELPVVVAINRFVTDTNEEIQLVQDACAKLGVAAFPVEVWAKGGAGALDLAEAVAKIADTNTQKFRPVYKANQPVSEKIEAIAKNIYGAAEVAYSPKALADLRKIKRLDLEGLYVCIAKTQYSFSDNPKQLGRPRNFTLTVREIEIAAGAGFLVPITGEMMRMPGLPEVPAATKIDIDAQGNISGLF